MWCYPLVLIFLCSCIRTSSAPISFPVYKTISTTLLPVVQLCWSQPALRGGDSGLHLTPGPPLLSRVQTSGRRLCYLSRRAAKGFGRVAILLARCTPQDDMWADPSSRSLAVLNRTHVFTRGVVFSTQAAEDAVPFAPEFGVSPFAALGALGIGAFRDESGGVVLASCDAHARYRFLGLLPKRGPRPFPVGAA